MNEQDETDSSHDDEITWLRNEIVRLRKSEDLLREKVLFLNTINDHLQDAILLLDLDFHIVWAGPSVPASIGFTWDELARMTMKELLTPDSLALAQNLIAASFPPVKATDRNREIVFNCDLEFYNRDGRPRWGHTLVKLVRDQEGRPRNLLCTIHDITDRKRMEDEIRESRELFSNIFKHSPLAMALTDLTDKRILNVNGKFLELTGYAYPEVIGRTAENLSLWAHPEERSAIVSQLLTQGSVQGHPAAIRARDGRILHFLFSAGRATVEGVPAMVTSALEITEHRHMEEALRESERRFRSLFDQVKSIPIQGYNEGRNVIYWNNASEDVYGFTAEEAIGRKLEDLIIPEAMREQVIDDVRRWTEGGPPIPASELILRDKQGKDVRVFSSHVMLTNLNGGKEMFCVDVNLKPLQWAENALRKFRAILNATKDAVVLLDAGGKILDGNTVHADLLQSTPDTLKGRCLWHFFPPETAARRRRAVESVFRTAIPVRIEDEQDGRWYDVSIHPVPDHQGHTRHVAVHLQDISSEKYLQERVQRMEKMDSLGMMAGGIAHDLNNALGILVGYAEMLLGDIDRDSLFREHVQNIMEGGERAAAIVQDLLTLAGRGAYKKKILNLNDIVSISFKTLEFSKWNISHPEMKIETELAADLLNVSGSSAHFEKMLMNLVWNAVEAMPEGGILTVKTANRRLDAPLWGFEEIIPGEYATIAVTDTGIGISSEDLRHIFEPFYTKKFLGRSGTGLGLAVVLGTVKDNDGYIDVRSEQGRGSTFTLYFPVTREKASPREATVPMERYRGNGETILVVDDEDGQRRLAALALARLNYKVVTAASGEQAIDYLKSNLAHLVVLDMIMDPGMDGLDTYREMIRVRPGQRAVIVSGYSETERVYEARDLGAGRYISKPYAVEKLGLAIRQELDRPQDRPEHP